MKAKIIYAVIFIGAFLLVTGAMYYGASSYENIFALNFKTVEQKKEPGKIENPEEGINKLDLAQLKRELIDSLGNLKGEHTYDTVSVSVKDTTLAKSIKEIFDELQKLKQSQQAALKQQKVEQPPVEIKHNAAAKSDTTYKIWVKNTVKLYESMDTKKAAKIIQGYSDNIARDIIFSMKKKKAAEIISQLKPETANRIISVQ
ncbi:MAG: hypothetical protein HYS25_08645 [Ignavibacteriales bacterium]|nr:hypothetical protein [Ignavibacteriales bacterium]